MAGHTCQEGCFLWGEGADNHPDAPLTVFLGTAHRDALYGTHVLSGVVLNAIVFYQASVGVFERRGHYEMVEKVGLYWHFVDLVWVFVFTFFYLI